MDPLNDCTLVLDDNGGCQLVRPDGSPVDSDLIYAIARRNSQLAARRRAKGRLMAYFPGARLLVALCLAVLAGIAVACGPIRPAPAGTKPCPDPSNYVDQGAVAWCQLQVGQRYVIQMPRSQGTDAALQAICLGVWHGTEFIVNFANLDYCVMPVRTA